MNRLYIFFLTVILSLGIIGGVSIKAKEYPGNEYAYESLTESEKRIFDSIGMAFEAFSSSSLYKTDLSVETAKISIDLSLASGSVTLEDIFRIAEIFEYANPDYYWISKSYSYSRLGDKVTLILKVDPYYYKYETRKSTDDKIAEVLSEWVPEIIETKQKKDIYYAALLAHDLLISEINYAYNDAGKPEEELWAHSIAGVFTGQGAVCEGYSKAFEYLMDLADIPNIYITGTADGGAHAWNAVKYNDKWYVCDITWDDPNKDNEAGFRDADYMYFFMPSSLFVKKHKANISGNSFVYELPSFADEMESSFYYRFKSIANGEFTSESGAGFVSEALLNRYEGSDYVHFVFPSTAVQSFVKYVLPNLPGVESTGSISYYNTEYGCLYKYLTPVIKNKATSITLDKTESEIDTDGDVVIKATLSEGSDDHVLWSIANFDAEDSSSPTKYVNMSIKGNELTVKGRKDGKVIVTATAYSSSLSENPVKAECIVTVGTGVPGADLTIWQNGKKEFKSATIKTDLQATSWKDSKGKTKKGKLVWFVSDTSTIPSFDSTKHTVSFKTPKSKSASVNNKGAVTAKKAGTVYVYVCDTGSLQYEENVVEILAAPAKIILTDIPNVTDKEDIVKKYGLEAGAVGRIYLNPYVKDGKADEDCTYTISVSKKETEKYVTFGKIEKDENGYLYFDVKGEDFDRTSGKAGTVKLDITCDQSGKKASMTVMITNPVFTVEGTVSGSSGDIILKKKGAQVVISLNLITCLNDVSKTTDKAKVYVGKTQVYLDENEKVKYDSGAGVKAKLDKDLSTLTITAGKDAGTTSLVSIAFTDPVSKETNLIDIAMIDASGKLKLL